ncbi:RNA polymerase sigma factor [Mangrovibacterium marinum]|uniref:RNA polymerase sigma-70 factor (ECF subfamily) n=1 Tax=Mangrovibacterium marinum TaxID=1639118 RepID=A0A2T5BZ57_9BACT|nr:sigma-70 family RNA polymerase sigma factor [Mangrovibacterium marinum]PTN07545.1 RNA polymerase sigma-70 factor (ECF subfamily) [Mangrovibacterium marinum]
MSSENYHIDRALLDRLREGDRQAFKALFDKYGVRLYHFAFKYLREKEDAEDLLHEVFLKIWENRENLRSDSSFQSYLFTIAYNNIRQRFLKKSREEKYIQVFAEEYMVSSAKNEDDLDYHFFLRKFNELIDLLPPRRKEIFVLRYKEEKKSGEIAEQLNISEQFVKKQLSIARRFVIDKMKEDNDLAGVLFLYLFAAQTPD